RSTEPTTTSPVRRRRRVVGMLVALVATVLAIIGAPGAPAGAAGFRTVAPPVDLGGPNGTEEHVATAINERGRIAGWSENIDPGGGEPNAWIQWPSRGIARQEIMPNYSASR